MTALAPSGKSAVFSCLGQFLAVELAVFVGVVLLQEAGAPICSILGLLAFAVLGLLAFAVLRLLTLAVFGFLTVATALAASGQGAVLAGLSHLLAIELAILVGVILLEQALSKTSAIAGAVSGVLNGGALGAFLVSAGALLAVLGLGREKQREGRQELEDLSGLDHGRFRLSQRRIEGRRAVLLSSGFQPC